MAAGTIELAITFTPAYFALVDCATAIAVEQGNEMAAEWARRTLEADLMLFVSIETPRPRLTLIEGGAP